jgi:hypothetical protein
MKDARPILEAVSPPRVPFCRKIDLFLPKDRLCGCDSARDKTPRFKWLLLPTPRPAIVQESTSPKSETLLKFEFTGARERRWQRGTLIAITGETGSQNPIPRAAAGWMPDIARV